MTEAIIFCDGSSIGNPGPGGWGASTELRNGRDIRVMELGGAAKKTTNNRMELTAAIEAISNVPKGAGITVHTDSRYVINGITTWVTRWEKNGWQTMGKLEVQNRDLWEALLRETRSREVVWEHVRGHAGHRLNERVDMIANGFARSEAVDLFKGTLDAYQEFLSGMPKARSVSSSSSKRGKAYSYVSQVDGKVMTHKTWADYEQRVKGKQAKYKKVFSAEEEANLLASWKQR